MCNLFLTYFSILTPFCSSIDIFNCMMQCTRGLQDAHRKRILRNIYNAQTCARFTPDARHIRKSEANVARTCRARNVTFGPFCSARLPLLAIYIYIVIVGISNPNHYAIPMSRHENLSIGNHALTNHHVLNVHGCSYQA
jgi:hypothetical protein